MGGLMVRLCRWDSSKPLIPRSFRGSCVGSALFVGFCSDNVIFFFLSLSLLLKKKTFTEKPEQGTRCTSLNVWDWGIASALRVLWRFRRRGHKRKTLLAFMLCLSSSPLGFEEFHSNAQQNEIVHLKKKSHFRPPPPSCQRPLSRHVTAH